jgi:O-acetyl-ADP-ribose deacetylase (regulator of RNase III)
MVTKMIDYLKGNLFESKAQVLVNTVNCFGIMGKGVALAFKKKYPEMYEHYRMQCKLGRVKPGELTLYRDTVPWVINFPTKRHWKGKSRLEYIEQGLQFFVNQYKDWEITSLAMPALGCGHGGLNWDDVKLLIEKHLGDLDIDIEVFEPGSELTEPVEQDLMPDLFGNMVEPPSVKKKSKRRTKKTK